ncbi:hypothetical protein L218DRAFT_988639 [Marasmius fiardii PR-910]|nr:hypothetical protein L218DRAFT_988639 [Marasmius fiardii PR-910]
MSTPQPSATASPQAQTQASSPFSTAPFRFIITFFHCLAIVFTIARLTRRIRIHRFSWDDAWAAVCLILIIMFLAVDWFRFESTKKEPSVGLFNQLNVFTKFTMAFYVLIIWLSRVSLFLSIARIFPSGRTRLTAILLSIVCLIIGLVLTIGETVSCSISPPKPGQPARLVCKPSLWTFFYIQIIGSILSSVALVIFPIRALFPSTVSTLRPFEHRLILVLFMSTTATLAMGLASAIFLVKGDSFKMTLFSDLEVSVSLMVCNFLVVITSIWRVLSRCCSRDKSRDGGGDDGVNDNYNTGEIPIGGIRNITNVTTTTTPTSHSTTGTGTGRLRSTNTDTTSRFSTLSALTDIAELQTPPHSLPSMLSTEFQSQLATANSRAGSDAINYSSPMSQSVPTSRRE